MQNLIKSFLTSLKAQMNPENFTFAKFITEETYLEGQKFSFKGHEYQHYCTELLQNNPGCAFAISKPSQIGMSEWIYRFVMAAMAVMPGTSVVLSMPSVTFSNEVFKTRLSPIIQESPALNNLIDYNNDSASVKRFVNSSIIYGLGGNEQAKSSLINRPVKMVVVDEVDRQVRSVYTGYRSRQTHAAVEERMTIMISTPTVSDFGIDLEVKECGVIHEPLVKCGHCSHEFLPDYFEDVVLPGYKESLLLLTKTKLAEIDGSLAYLQCPKCKKDIDKAERKVVWKITRNKRFSKKSIGIKLNPWIAHSFISIPDLVKASTTYTSHTEFLNQSLGKTALISDSAIERSVFCFVPEPEPEGLHIYGLDMGKVCTWMQGVLKHDTTLRITEARQVKLTKLEEFLETKHSEFVFSKGVMDQQPMPDMAYRLVRKYPRLYSCIYLVRGNDLPELYRLKENDKYNELIRQVALNKTLAFDTFFDMLKEQVTFKPSDMDATIIKHFLTLRKVRDHNTGIGDGLVYKWVNTSKENHFAHAYIYLCTAAKLATAGIDSGFGSIPVVIKSMNPDKLRRQGRRRRA